MGATNFRAFAESESAEQAYAQLVREAQHERGHEGYNGTISTTHGFTVIQAKPVTVLDANKIEAAEWAKEESGTERPRFEKWGKCCAVRVVDATRKLDGWLFFGLAAE